MRTRKFTKSNLKTTSWFEKRLEFIGPILEEEGYNIWGTSPIKDDEGNIHLFTARWPNSFKFDPAWRDHSEIAHYVGPGPEGPFSFKDVVATGSGLDRWDKVSAHNPNVKKVGEKYVLVYISNKGIEGHPANQSIGIKIADDLNGPWLPINGDGLAVSPPTSPDIWNFGSGIGVSNPAFLAHPSGKYFIYFKSKNSKGEASMGLAIASNLEGPYEIQPEPVTSNDKYIEDGYAFNYNGKIYLVTTDNFGTLLFGGLLIWESEDGYSFDEPQNAALLVPDYMPVGTYKPRKTKKIYGAQPKFERPQILMENGTPTYLYVPSGHNVYGKKRTCCMGFKIHPQPIR